MAAPAAAGMAALVALVATADAAAMANPAAVEWQWLHQQQQARWQR